MKYLTPKEIDFLEQSNFIEGVRDGLDDAIKAWKFLIDQPLLSDEVILKTHELLMKNRDLLPEEIGQYRKSNVMVGGRICPHWPEVPALMWKWQFEVIRSYPPPDDRALHVIYEKIHPFVDGNGRTGRMFMNWTRIKRSHKPLLIIWEEDKHSYYEWFR